jgi:hypothetical protein
MARELVIYGEIKEGKLIAKRPDLRGWKDGPVTLTIKPKRKTRTPPQNRAWWSLVIPLIAEHLGYDHHEHDMLHYALVEKCFGSEWDARIKADVPRVRSSQLDTVEFAELYSWAQRYAATEWGLNIPDPE